MKHRPLLVDQNGPPTMVTAAPAAVRRPLERVAFQGLRWSAVFDGSCGIRGWNGIAPPPSHGRRRPADHHAGRRASACATVVKRGGDALRTPKQSALFPRARLLLRRVRVQPWQVKPTADACTVR